MNSVFSSWGSRSRTGDQPLRESIEDEAVGNKNSFAIMIVLLYRNNERKHSDIKNTRDINVCHKVIDSRTRTWSMYLCIGLFSTRRLSAPPPSVSSLSEAVVVESRSVPPQTGDVTSPPGADGGMKKNC